MADLGVIYVCANADLSLSKVGMTRNMECREPTLCTASILLMHSGD